MATRINTNGVHEIQLADGSWVVAIALINSSGAAAIGQAAASASMPVVDAADTWTSPDNGIISVGTSATTLIAASSAGVRKRNAVLYNMGAQTVSIRFGADPTVGTHFPLVAGATLNVSNLLVVKGIVASGTCNVAVLSEAAS